MKDEIVMCGIFLAFGLMGGILLDAAVNNRDWKADAIQHGFAHYNETNGNWEWKTNLPLVVTNTVINTLITTNTVYTWPNYQWQQPIYTNFQWYGFSTNGIILRELQ